MKASRQVRRHTCRTDAFKMVSEHYPGEPRRRRRAMASALGKKWYKAQSGGSLEAEAPALGAGSREFESRPPDQSNV